MLYDVWGGPLFSQSTPDRRFAAMDSNRPFSTLDDAGLTDFPPLETLARREKLSALLVASAIVLLALISFGSIYSHWSARRAADELEHLITARAQVQSFTRNLLEIEIAVLGFVTTSRADFTTLFERMRREQPDRTRQLQDVLSGDETDRDLRDRLITVQQTVTRQAERVLERTRSGGAAAGSQQIVEDAERGEMRALRVAVDQWNASNGLKIEQVRSNGRAAQSLSLFTILCGSGLVLVIGFVWLRNTRRQLALVADVNGRLRSTAESLAKGVSDRATRLSVATSAAAFGVFEWEQDEDRAVWDRRMFQIFERSPELGPLDRQTFLDKVIHPEDRERFEQALQEGLARKALDKIECRVLKENGSIGWIRLSARVTAPRDHRGNLLVGVVEDITEEKLRGIELEKTLALLKALTDSTPDLVFAKDREGRLIFANPATLLTIGKPWSALQGLTDVEWHDKRHEAESNMLNDQRVMRSGEPEIVEETFTSGDTPAIFLSTKAPLFDKNGLIVGMVGLSTDITERKAHEEQRQFLMRELTHRSKNLLAVVQSMARQTAMMSSSLEDFQTRFSARLMGLATSHDLLLQEDWRGASVRQLVVSQLGHLIDLIDQRILLTGPDGLLLPEAAQNIGLALHELSTNASKYGALSNDTGQVFIRWGLLPSGAGREESFFIQWQEDGGPPVTAPTRRGFGHSVVERLVARALDGQVQLAFRPEGVSWRLEIPRSYVMRMRDGDLSPTMLPGITDA